MKTNQQKQQHQATGMLLTFYLKKGKSEKVAQGRERKAVMRETRDGKRKMTLFFLFHYFDHTGNGDRAGSLYNNEMHHKRDYKKIKKL